MSTPVALITGASSGIGEAVAYRLAGEGEDLVLVSRTQDRLESVAQAIAAKSGKKPLVIAIDLGRPDAASILRDRIAEAGGKVRHLINSAGYGLLGDVGALALDGQLGMIDLNCRATVALSAMFLPDIVAQKGGILNVGSVAGFVPGPGFATYYASKAFVISFTRALRTEMKACGITVSVLCPGPTATGFGARSGILSPWAGALMHSMTAEAVAKAGIDGYRAGKSVIVPGFKNKVMVALFGALPTRFFLPLVAAAQRKRQT